MATYGTYNSPGPFKLTIYGLVIAACFLAMFYFTRSMYRGNFPPAINRDRAAERAKARKELTEKANAELADAGWVDKPKGIARLPIQRAMELTIQRYQNPEEARSNLVERAKKAAAPAPVQSFE
jgi:hypothetical protein